MNNIQFLLNLCTKHPVNICAIDVRSVEVRSFDVSFADVDVVSLRTLMYFQYLNVFINHVLEPYLGVRCRLLFLLPFVL